MAWCLVLWFLQRVYCLRALVASLSAETRSRRAIITEVGVVTKDDSQSFIAGLREQLQSVSAA
jgi:hypothetical protein